MGGKVIVDHYVMYMLYLLTTYLLTTYLQMKYTFSRVFGETTSQKHLFDCVGAPLVDDLVRGKNGKSDNPRITLRRQLMSLIA